MAQRVMAVRNAPAPVFIVGSGRSGTTLTAALLNRLPGIHIAKETGFLGLYLARFQDIGNTDALLSLIGDVNSWLSANLWKNRASLSGFHTFCELSDLQGGEAFVHYIWQLDSPVAWQELSFIGDNSPLYLWAMPGLQSLLPNARFVHLVRDPRDVIASMLNMRFGADNVVVGALEWHNSVGCWLMAERFISIERRIECRYEDLCANPQASLIRLAAFLGRSPEHAVDALAAHVGLALPAETGFEPLLDLPHHLNLNKPISTGKIGRYKTEISASSVRKIEEIAQFGMLAYGYEPEKFRASPMLKEDRLYIYIAMTKDIINRMYKRIHRFFLFEH